MSQHIERVHYTAIHTALEQYFQRDIPGSLTRIEYPAHDDNSSRAKLYFSVMDDE